jgi:hypothetical protein
VTRSSVQEQIAEAIRICYPLPPELARLRTLAIADLWHGPLASREAADDDGEPWPGFSAAVAQLSEWADDNLPSTVWYDEDCGSLSTSEPEGSEDEETGEWIEPYLETTYLVERSEILAAVFPRQLAGYL